MGDWYRIRMATLHDAPVIAWHRVAMFRDMGRLTPELHAPLLQASTEFLSGALDRGDYFGWLVETTTNPGTVIAGAGLQVRVLLPHPGWPGKVRPCLGPARQGYVLNVFTEPAWRRRGLAGILMSQVIEWAKENGLDSLVLHASDEGRSLYEQLGFTATNEMRFSGKLFGDR